MAPVQGVQETSLMFMFPIGALNLATGELFSQTLISTWAIWALKKGPKRLLLGIFGDDKLHNDVYIFAGNIINHCKDPY